MAVGVGALAAFGGYLLGRPMGSHGVATMARGVLKAVPAFFTSALPKAWTNLYNRIPPLPSLVFALWAVPVLYDSLITVLAVAYVLLWCDW